MTKILVIDDDHAAADTLSHLLSGMGHEVRTAYRGEDALPAAEALLPHIIFLDLLIDGVDGFEAARRIRGSAIAGQPFIVALTARLGPDLDRVTKAAGFDLYVAKPTDFAVLIMIVESLSKRDRGAEPAA